MSKALGMHALVDPGAAREARKQRADVRRRERATVERAEERLTPVETLAIALAELGALVDPPL